jgi:hypothetical protein
MRANSQVASARAKPRTACVKQAPLKGCVAISGLVEGSEDRTDTYSRTDKAN